MKQSRGHLVSDHAAGAADMTVPAEALQQFETNHIVPLSEVAESMFRQWRFVAGLFLSLVWILTLYLMVKPIQYEAEMLILVKNSRAGFVEVPAGDLPDSLTAQETELLTSRDLVRDVIKNCHLRRGHESEASAIRRFDKMLTVSPVLRTSMIRVRYSDTSPEKAVQVLQYLSSAYLAKHLAVHSTPGSYQFFDAQANMFENQLKQAQAAYTTFQKEHQIVTLNDQEALTLRKMIDVEASRGEALAGQQEEAERARSIRKMLDGTSQRIVTTAKKLPNQESIERLTTLLTELQNKRIELRSKYPDDDRNVQQVNQQIDSTRAALQRVETNTAMEESSDVNPLHLTLENELSRAQYTETSSLARARALERNISGYRAQLDAYETLSSKDSKFTRTINELTENYLLYTRKREEARIAEELDRQKISNVSIAEAPSLPVAPKSIFSAGVIGIFLLGSCLIGVVAFWRGARLPGVYTPYQLETIAALPVVACLEYVE